MCVSAFHALGPPVVQHEQPTLHSLTCTTQRTHALIQLVVALGLAAAPSQEEAHSQAKNQHGDSDARGLHVAHSTGGPEAHSVVVEC